VFPRHTGSARSTGLLAALVVAVVAVAGCASSKPSGQGSSGSSAGGNSSAAAGGSAGSVTFDNVTVDGATDLANKPKVTAKSTTAPAALEVKDLVTGQGAAASPSSSVTVQYVGVLYSDGKQFDASWDHGGALNFSLQQVVAGFTQGIGGNQQVAPMKMGGRRIMILPAAMGYGASGTPDGSVPPNAPLVFVVDLISVS
jgi:peptidylprolyl isomerase